MVVRVLKRRKKLLLQNWGWTLNQREKKLVTRRRKTPVFCVCRVGHLLTHTHTHSLTHFHDFIHLVLLCWLLLSAVVCFISLPPNDVLVNTTLWRMKEWMCELGGGIWAILFHLLSLFLSRRLIQLNISTWKRGEELAHRILVVVMVVLVVPGSMVRNMLSQHSLLSIIG